MIYLGVTVSDINVIHHSTACYQVLMFQISLCKYILQGTRLLYGVLYFLTTVLPSPLANLTV